MLENLELKLLSGYSIETEVGDMYQPKIKDIIDIDESQYNQFIGLLLYDTDVMESRKEIMESFELTDITTLEFLVIQSFTNAEVKDIITNALEFFFKQPISLSSKYGVFHIGNIEDMKIINTKNYKYIKDVLIKMNYLKELEEEEEIDFANEMAREWYMNIKKMEQNQPKPKPQVNLHSIISAMMWRTNKSIDEILNMTVYQLYDGYHRLFLIDDCLGVKQGIYSGTIDSSKIKPVELNWAKIIKHEN